MGKLVAFIGPPGSGKTSVAMKTAIEVYCATKSNQIVLLSPDFNVPGVGLIFPNYAPDDLYSLGKIYDTTDVTFETVAENAVTVKSMKDFLFLGFKTGETRLSFPLPTDGTISDLFSVLIRNTSFTFVDCSDDNLDPLSENAVRLADVIVRVIPSDLKGIGWYATNKYLHGSEGRHFLNVVTVTNKDLYLPTDEICNKIGEVTTTLPYSRMLARQMLDGSLYERLKDNGYNRKLKELVTQILRLEEN